MFPWFLDTRHPKSKGSLDFPEPHSGACVLPPGSQFLHGHALSPVDVGAHGVSCLRWQVSRKEHALASPPLPTRTPVLGSGPPLGLIEPESPSKGLVCAYGHTGP